DCDIVVQDERVSRHHALVRVVEGGVEVVPLGTRPITLAGRAIDGAYRMNDGDRLEIEGGAFVLRSEAVPAEPDTHWFVERHSGVLVGVPGERATLGGGNDDIVIAGWPERTVAVAALGERMVLEATASGVHVGRALDVGEMINVTSGDRVAWSKI